MLIAYLVDGCGRWSAQWIDYSYKGIVDRSRLVNPNTGEVCGEIRPEDDVFSVVSNRHTLGYYTNMGIAKRAIEHDSEAAWCARR